MDFICHKPKRVEPHSTDGDTAPDIFFLPSSRRGVMIKTIMIPGGPFLAAEDASHSLVGSRCIIGNPSSTLNPDAKKTEIVALYVTLRKRIPLMNLAMPWNAERTRMPRISG